MPIVKMWELFVLLNESGECSNPYHGADDERQSLFWSHLPFTRCVHEFCRDK